MTLSGIKLSGLAAVLMLVFCVAPSVQSAEKSDNPIANSGFEKAKDGLPDQWKRVDWSGKGQGRLVKGGRVAGRCVLLESVDGGDIAWTQFVPVVPDTYYRLGGWIKTENVKSQNGAKGAVFNIHQGDCITKGIKGTHDWTYVSAVFNSGASKQVRVCCLFGGWGTVVGRAWFDDVSLKALSENEVKNLPQPEVKLTTPSEGLASATIDLSVTDKPMSKYIYAQFIEHLGRCIYGGIWAEMLEDRKFCLSVNASNSHWKPLGGKVAMIEKDSFVGDHTPRLSDGVSIQQRGLSLVQGKGYEGYVWLKGESPSAKATITLRWSDGDKGRQVVAIDDLTPVYKKFPLKFKAGASTKDGKLAIKITGGNCLIGTVSLMPDDNIDGMRVDTLKLLKELDAPLYRWPGGNFVSGYDWRDGIGSRDRRPPRMNPAWTGIEHNDFGTDEFIAFCRHLKTEPLIVVNTGFGDAYSAAQWLEYANGSADTLGGSWRVKNGTAEPFNVRWWGIGNEMFGRWQLGYMALKHYTRKHNRVVDKMLAVDPTIKTLAVGNAGEWSEGMLTNCAGRMDILSLHFYCQGKDNVVEHYRQVPNHIRKMAVSHRESCRKVYGGKIMPVAMDEWNFWYGPHVYGELGTRYFLKDALGIAAGLHEFSRNTDVYAMAQYAQTVNVIGCIKTNGTDASFATTGLVLKMYKQQFGQIPVPITSNCDEKGLDIAAMLTKDRKTLTIAVVNPHGVAVPIKLNMKKGSLSSKGKVWQIAGNHPLLYNEPGKINKVTIQEKPVTLNGKITVPPLSASIFRFGIE
jgi:alpha-N-arabinofuranosidase